jgi:TrmH family RNA methyltransferase
VPTSLGAHSSRVGAARELLSPKGRRKQERFPFEGATLLNEAVRSGVRIEEIFVTQAALETHPSIEHAEREGTPVYVVDDRTMRKLSDVDTPSGIVSIAAAALGTAADLFEQPGLVLGLAGITDPGNAGTLLRSAEAFGVRGVLFGSGGVEPYHPKVVRGAMGAIFRLRVAAGAPATAGAAAAGWQITGLAASGTPLAALSWGPRSLLLVGSERHGLGEWESLCERLAAIPMAGSAESLNAAVAGSIALYEAGRRIGT